MKSLNHVNVVRLHEIINDSDHEKLYMGMLFGYHRITLNLLLLFKF